MYNYRNGTVLDEKRTETLNSVKTNAEKDTSLNFDMILNYEKYKKPSVMPEVREEAKNVCAEEETVLNKEDITPSSTTMQFSNLKDEEIYEGVKVKKIGEVDKRYKINTKGKLLIAVYAVAILTIFALILLNARMLHDLDGSIEKYNDTVTQLNEQNVRLENQLDAVSDNDAVIRKAEEFGMVRG